MAIKLLAKDDGNAYLIGQGLDPMTRVQKADFDDKKAYPVKALDQWMAFGHGAWNPIQDDPEIIKQVRKLRGFDEKELNKPPFTEEQLAEQDDK